GALVVVRAGPPPRAGGPLLLRGRFHGRLRRGVGGILRRPVRPPATGVGGTAPARGGLLRRAVERRHPARRRFLAVLALPALGLRRRHPHRLAVAARRSVPGSLLRTGPQALDEQITDRRLAAAAAPGHGVPPRTALLRGAALVSRGRLRIREGGPVARHALARPAGRPQLPDGPRDRRQHRGAVQADR